MSEVNLIALIVAIVMILGVVAFSVRRWRKGKDIDPSTIRLAYCDVLMSNKELEALTAAFDAAGFHTVLFEKFDGNMNYNSIIMINQGVKHGRYGKPENPD